MPEMADSVRSQAEQRKLDLEIQKLTREVESAANVARIDVALRLMPAITVLVTVLGFIFVVWQYRTEQIKTRVALNQQNLKEAAERLERAHRNDEAAQRGRENSCFHDRCSHHQRLLQFADLIK